MQHSVSLGVKINQQALACGLLQALNVGLRALGAGRTTRWRLHLCSSHTALATKPATAGAQFACLSSSVLAARMAAYRQLESELPTAGILLNSSRGTQN